MEGQTEGITSPIGEKFTPGGQLRPWGSKFAPRDEVKNGSLLSENNKISYIKVPMYVDFQNATRQNANFQTNTVDFFTSSTLAP
jgi:hypothetical protein